MVLTKRHKVFDRLMGVAEVAAKKGICFKMGFKKDISFWDMLDNTHL
jgi:hypothetical protein